MILKPRQKYNLSWSSKLFVSLLVVHKLCCLRIKRTFFYSTFAFSFLFCFLVVSMIPGDLFSSFVPLCVAPTVMHWQRCASHLRNLFLLCMNYPSILSILHSILKACPTQPTNCSFKEKLIHMFEFRVERVSQIKVVCSLLPVNEYSNIHCLHLYVLLWFRTY